MVKILCLETVRKRILAYRWFRRKLEVKVSRNQQFPLMACKSYTLNFARFVADQSDPGTRQRG